MFPENYAIWKHPRKGKCPKSPFAIGYHRVGCFPIMSLLDGGASGDSCREICLECGKWFKDGWFKVIKQPNKLTSTLRHC
jgi:hypothetical protein